MNGIDLYICHNFESTMALKKEHISALRLQHQHIGNKSFTKPAEVVRWMGALQAQDYEMSKWAVGVRMHKATDALVEKALDAGEILRTHVLRPTWHLVAAEDLPWMLELTAPHVKRTAAYSHKQLGLEEEILKKSNALIEKALTKHGHLSRKELMEALQEAKMDTSANRASHFLFAAELDGLICSGPSKGKKLSYALLEDRVPKTPKLNRDEALATLAQRYFASHGPATLKDFAWWSGLSPTDAKKGLLACDGQLHKAEIEGAFYWYAQLDGVRKNAQDIHILPAYDEFIISYADRSASLDATFGKHAISNNGIFKATIIVDGQVIGTWKRTLKPKQVLVSMDFFNKPTEATIEKVRAQFDPYAHFLAKELVLEL